MPSDPYCGLSRKSRPSRAPVEGVDLHQLIETALDECAPLLGRGVVVDPAGDGVGRAVGGDAAAVEPLHQEERRAEVRRVGLEAADHGYGDVGLGTEQVEHLVLPLEVRLQEDRVHRRLHAHDEALGDLAAAAV